MLSLRVACVGALLLSVASHGVQQSSTMLDILKPKANFNITIINNINIYVNSVPGEPSEPEVPVVSKTYYLAKDEKLDWYSASYYCRRIGLELVKIESSLETIALQKFFELNNEVEENFWTGGNTLEDGYFWRWGINGDAIQYKNWAVGEPKDIKGYNKCIQVDGKAVEWSVLGCATKLYAVCESAGKATVRNETTVKEL